jgi:hypothetical protein
LLAALTTAFPDHPWEKSRFDARGGKKSVQRMMLHALQQIFPTHEIKEDFTYSSMEYTGMPGPKKTLFWFFCCSVFIVFAEMLLA